jgi:flagellar biosynthetic protein FliP
MRRLRILLTALWLFAPFAGAQAPPAPLIGPPAPAGAGAGGPVAPTAAPTTGPALTLQLPGDPTAPDQIGSSLQIVLLMTLLSLAPAIVLTMTCFTRIVIVLSFLKRALSMQEFPPTLVVTGFSLFLSLFVMRPVLSDMHAQAYVPYVERQIGFTEATERAAGRMKQFMLSQTRVADVALILEISKTPPPASPDQLPLTAAVPAFVLSEIKTAFQMGFVLFLPFVVIDLVIASLLVSMGMFTLPPVVVSTPLKIMLFVLVDGWNLVVGSLAGSFVQV